MLRQSTNQILMIHPAIFRRNEQTEDNLFQNDGALDADTATERAQDEFDGLVTLLRDKGVDVVVVNAIEEADTPDALFPNNWVSFHSDGRAALYPMRAENRRRERREEIIDFVCNELGLELNEIVDFTEFEEHDKFLEGTGSLVLDRLNNKAYAALSERTDRQAVERFCEALGYEGILFHATQPTADGGQAPVYHTNVVLSIGTSFALICSASIADEDEREMVLESLREHQREIIDLSLEQMNSFAGNALEVLNSEGQRFVVMSERARKSLTPDQIGKIELHAEILSAPLQTIENLGGGSARCMLCEVFLPKL